MRDLTREEQLEQAVDKTRALCREHEALTAGGSENGWRSFRDACVLYVIYEGARLADYVEEKIL